MRRMTNPIPPAPEWLDEARRWSAAGNQDYLPEDTIPRLIAKLAAAEAENERLLNEAGTKVGLAIARIERGEPGAALTGLRALREALATYRATHD